jgi:leucyl aminopeptidase (aminopeptidase T)
MQEAIDNIFKVNLGIKKTERVLIFTDNIREDEVITKDQRERRIAMSEVARRIAEAGKNFAEVVFVDYPAAKDNGEEPPEAIWEAALGSATVEALKEGGSFERILAKKPTPEDITKAEVIVTKGKGAAVDAIIGLANFSTSHTKFRDITTRRAGVRYASMPSFEASMLDGVMTADWPRLAKRTIKLAEVLGLAEDIHITTPNGTDIRFSIKGRPVKPDTGILTEAGSFSNLPAGEAFCAPIEGTANGQLVLSWSPTRKLEAPVTVTVKDGRAVTVSGDEPYAAELQATIDANPLRGNIAELGVGTNEKASRADSVLESEKILGTIHIALGDNSTFGGKVRVPFHQDFVFYTPTMTAEAKGIKTTILEAGKLLID